MVADAGLGFDQAGLLGISAHNLGMQVVIGGVETHEQFNFLCRKGYLFSRGRLPSTI